MSTDTIRYHINIVIGTMGAIMIMRMTDLVPLWIIYTGTNITLKSTFMNTGLICIIGMTMESKRQPKNGDDDEGMMSKE